MKKYIKENLQPILIGATMAMIVMWMIHIVSDTIVKIALINAK